MPAISRASASRSHDHGRAGGKAPREERRSVCTVTLGLMRSRPWQGCATARPRACAGLTSTRLQSRSPGSTSARRRTGVPRSIPVHLTLDGLLREWKQAGWERIYGRPPASDDLIVPTRNMATRESPEAQKALHEDLALLELRPRRPRNR
jgi:hypothetical protein